jgi:hypothetical protein
LESVEREGNKKVKKMGMRFGVGYDNSHGYHHRHFMGTIEPVEFDTYEALHDRFQAEVFELWKEEETI